MMLKTAFKSNHILRAVKDDGLSIILTNEADACDENGRALYNAYRIEIPHVAICALKPSQIETAYAKGYLKNTQSNVKAVSVQD